MGENGSSLFPDTDVGSTAPASDENGPMEQILVVDDDEAIRKLLVGQVRAMGYPCRSAVDGNEALSLAVVAPKPALVVSDVQMPGLNGFELLQRIKSLSAKTQVVMVSGHHDMAIVRDCLREGAYDYLIKPFELEELSNTIRRALDRYHLLEQNEAYRIRLEQMVEAQTQEISQTRDIALMTLAKLAESRDTGTGMHLERIAEFSRCLAEVLAEGGFGRPVSAQFVEQLYKSSPLHDIGKVGISDAILLKNAPLDEHETKIMQSHTTIGGDTLRSVIESYQGHTFLLMAMEIAYYHHERWDGNGYPHGIGGEQIPLSARIVALADAYDAITSVRPYKEALPHAEAITRIEADRGKHFDPALVDAFLASEATMRSIKNSPLGRVE